MVSAPPPPVSTTNYPQMGKLSSEVRLDTSGYVIKADGTRITSAASTASDDVTIVFEPATSSYRVKASFLNTVSYGPAQAASGQSYLGDGFDYFGMTVMSGSDPINVRVAVYKPTGGSGHAVPLTYTTLLWTDKQMALGGKPSYDLALSYTGFRTAAGDMPRTGAASYNGPAHAFYWLNATNDRATLQGAVAVTADFAAGSLNTSLYLNRFGYSTLTLTGNGTISGNLFQGTLAGRGYAGVDMPGRFEGQFMGPGAAELGLRFTASDGAAAIQGVAAARK